MSMVERLCQKKYEDSKCVEGLDENTSCISQTNQANIADGSNERNIDGVNVLRSSDFLSQVASEVLRSAPHFEKPSFSDIPSTNDADSCPVGCRRSPKEEVSEYSKGNTASTCLMETASAVVHGEKSVVQEDELVKNSAQYEVANKPKDLIDLPHTCKAPSRSLPEDESDESDIVEQDVKVCDICGDAGHEAELAICSRCSDGAEHIYCMRDMLKKLPDGDWLCEECKAEERKNRKQDVKANAVNSPQIPGKRHVESIEVGPESKKQALESGSGSPMESSPKKASQLFRESSLKSTERGKLKPSHQMSSCEHSRISDVTMIRSPASFQPALGSKGPLLKSYSFNAFNSKPKVKLVDEVPPKQKGAREHIIKDLKERPGNLLSKSISFKSVNSSWPNVTESKYKMLSPKVAHVQDQKGLKQMKERSAFDRNKFEHPVGMSGSISPSMIDQRLVNHVESNHKEFRAAQDGKLSTLSKTSSSVACKKDSSAGALSTGGPCASVSEKKLNHFNASDDSLPCFPSSSTEKSSISVDKNPQVGLLPAGESKILGDKIRHSSVISCTQAAALKCNVCQNCKELGHSTEFCTSVKAQENGSDVSAAKNSEEIVRKGNALKAAIHAALLRRPEICKKKVINQEPDELSTSNSDINGEIAEQSFVPNGSKSDMSAEVILEGRAATENSLCGSFESSATLDAKHLSVCIGDAQPSKPGNLDLYDSSSTKPSVRSLSNQSSSNAQIILETSTIPEYECIWQGCFEVLRSGQPPELCRGMQAHLSCCTSPKVFEVVAKSFSKRIHLNELPRMSVWPSQFHQTGAREDNIALYFFAKEIESYEKYYKSLLDRMMKNDLALKGNFEGVEFLVFPSNHLPDKSQRWNMLFYLWGVFRGKRTNASDGLKSSVPGSDQPYPQKDFPSAAMTLCELRRLQKCTEEFMERDRTCNVIVTSNAPDLMKKCFPDNGLDCNALPKVIGTAVSSMHKKTKIDSGTSDGSFSPKVGVHGNRDKGAVKNVAVVKTVDGIDDDRKRLKEQPKEEHTLSGTEPYSQRDHIANEVETREIKDEIKLKMDCSETVSQASAAACPKRPCSEVNDEHGENVRKKLKTGYDALYGRSSSKGRDSSSESFATSTDELVSCKLVDKLCNTSCDEKIIHEDLGARERHFFPVNHSRLVNDFHSEEKSILWEGLQTENEGKCQDEVPNLELALGSELKVPSKGSLPSLFGVVDKKNNQDKLPDRANDEQAEDGEATSLSLSLSFPSSDKQQSLKLASKSEQLLPERHHVNSSLLFFGGLLDK